MVIEACGLTRKGSGMTHRFVIQATDRSHLLKLGTREKKLVAFSFVHVKFEVTMRHSNGDVIGRLF